MVIRIARAGDAAQLAALAEETFRATFGSSTSAANMDTYCASAYSETIQAREIADPGLLTLVIEDNEQLIAFAQWRPNQAIDCVKALRPSELNRIYVVNEWHGHGVAQMLIAMVLEAARDANSDVVWLGVWENNAKAITFYRKYGFAAVGDHVFAVGDDPQRDLILAKTIAPAE